MSCEVRLKEDSTEDHKNSTIFVKLQNYHAAQQRTILGETEEFTTKRGQKYISPDKIGSFELRMPWNSVPNLWNRRYAEHFQSFEDNNCKKQVTLFSFVCAARK